MTDRREHLAHGVLGLLAERSGLDDPVHYCDRVTREERLRAAIETTLGRTLAAAVSDDEQVMFEALGPSPGSARSTSHSRRIATATRAAATRTVKDATYEDCATRVTRSFMVTRSWTSPSRPSCPTLWSCARAPTPTASRASSRRVVWTFKPTLLPLPRPDPKLEAEYAAYVGGQDVITVIREAVNWLDRTLSTR